MFLEGFDYRRQLNYRTDEHWHNVIWEDAEYTRAEEQLMWTEVVLTSLGLTVIGHQVLNKHQTVKLTPEILTEIVDMLALSSVQSGHETVGAQLLGLVDEVKVELKISNGPSPAYELALHRAREKLGVTKLESLMLAGRDLLKKSPTR